MSGEPHQDYLPVIIDNYFRYVKTVFSKKKEIFSQLGHPQIMKVDNAINFNSAVFKNYCSTNRIDLMNYSSYWPQATGEIENIIKSLKKRLQLAHQNNNEDNKKEILAYLMMNDITPNGTTGTSRNTAYRSV